MKKIVCLLLSFCLLFSLTSCSYNVKVNGKTLANKEAGKEPDIISDDEIDFSNDRKIEVQPDIVELPVDPIDEPDGMPDVVDIPLNLDLHSIDSSKDINGMELYKMYKDNKNKTIDIKFPVYSKDGIEILGKYNIKWLLPDDEYRFEEIQEKIIERWCSFSSDYIEFKEDNTNYDFNFYIDFHLENITDNEEYLDQAYRYIAESVKSDVYFDENNLPIVYGTVNDSFAGSSYRTVYDEYAESGSLSIRDYSNITVPLDNNYCLNINIEMNCGSSYRDDLSNVDINGLLETQMHVLDKNIESIKYDLYDLYDLGYAIEGIESSPQFDSVFLRNIME